MHVENDTGLGGTIEMNTNPGGGSVVLMFLLLLAVAGCTLLPGTGPIPVGAGPQAPVAASPAP